MTKRMGWIVGGLVVLVVGVLITRFWFISFISPVPDTLGWQGDTFEPCSSAARCVSTTDNQKRQSYIDPIRLAIPASEAHQQFVTMLDNMPRAKIITRTGSYIHAETRSLTWGFIDDVEIYIDIDNNLIHMRSEARFAPISDMFVNRNRIQAMKTKFEDAS